MEISAEHIVRLLLERYGQLFSEALGIELKQGSPSVLFQWLCASLLFSARIRAQAAEQAAKALFREGWTTAAKMAEASWEERTLVLNRSGYARYDGITSRMLGDTARLLLERYQGDLGKLREAAARQPRLERRLLKEFKGIGDVGADIFFREVQAVWEELYPFADRRALHAATALGLGSDARTLAGLVDRETFPRLVAALVRADLGKHHQQLLAEAART